MGPVFSGFLTPVLTQVFFPKPPTTFLICFCRGDSRKYAAKKSCLNQGSNSQPPGHESDALTTEPPGRGPGFKVSSERELHVVLARFASPGIKPTPSRALPTELWGLISLEVENVLSTCI